jgi:hypothetical protein
LSAEATRFDLEAALDRIDDFRAIHEPGGVSLEAVLCLQEAVGIDEPTRAVIRERLFHGGEGPERAATLLGLIIGLLAVGYGRPSSR